MRLTKIALVILSSMALISTVYAEEGVMVDLSVLNNLNSSPYLEAEPLFPVLPDNSKSKHKAVEKKIEKKNMANSKLQKAERVKKQKKEPKKPQITEPNELKEVKVILDSKEKVEVVDVEPVAPLIEQNAVKENISEQSAEIDVNKDVSSDEAPQNEAIVSNAEENSNSLADSQQPKINESITELLVDANEQKNIAKTNAIVFGEDEDILSPSNQEVLDSIIAKFKNEKDNKIAIYSYNLDDGVDSFRKKRTSLNRAIEIRSYLLKKGYKNFSIKVVNVSTGSDKINTVELEEI